MKVVTVKLDGTTRALLPNRAIEIRNRVGYMKSCLRLVLKAVRSLDKISVVHYGYNVQYSPGKTTFKIEYGKKIELGDIFETTEDGQLGRQNVPGVILKLDIKAKKVGLLDDTQYPQAAKTELGRSLVKELRQKLPRGYLIGVQVFNGTIEINIKFPKFIASMANQGSG